MSANTEMSRLDSLPTATLNKLIQLAESADTLLSIPAVSKDDNGKVLTVADGAWAAVDPKAGE